MNSFKLSLYCLLQQLTCHNVSRADSPWQPLPWVPGDKTARQLPLFTKQKHHTDLQSFLRFESMHVTPTKWACWGSCPPKQTSYYSHSSSSLRFELGHPVNAGLEILPRALQGREAPAPSGTAAVQLRGCSWNARSLLPAFLPAGGVAVPLPCMMPSERGVPTEVLPNCPRTLFLRVRLMAVYLMKDAKKAVLMVFEGERWVRWRHAPSNLTVWWS